MSAHWWRPETTSSTTAMSLALLRGWRGSATHLNISIGAKNISIPHQIQPHQIFNFGPQTGDTQNGLPLIPNLTVTLKIQTNSFRYFIKTFRCAYNFLGRINFSQPTKQHQIGVGKCSLGWWLPFSISAVGMLGRKTEAVGRCPGRGSAPSGIWGTRGVWSVWEGYRGRTGGGWWEGRASPGSAGRRGRS